MAKDRKRRGAGLQPRWPDRLATLARSRRRGGRRSRIARRAAAFLLLLGAGAMAISEQNVAVGGISVLSVVRDLPAGADLGAADLAVIALPVVPDGALHSPSQAVGRHLSAPIRRGEVITDARLVATNGPDPGPGRVAVPVRPADPGTVDLLSPGVHVAVLSVAQDGKITVLAKDAVVLAIPAPSKADPARRLVVLAVPAAAADSVAATGISGSVALRFT